MEVVCQDSKIMQVMLSDKIGDFGEPFDSNVVSA